MRSSLRLLATVVAVVTFLAPAGARANPVHADSCFAGELVCVAVGASYRFVGCGTTNEGLQACTIGTEITLSAHGLLLPGSGNARVDYSCMATTCADIGGSVDCSWPGLAGATSCTASDELYAFFVGPLGSCTHYKVTVRAEAYAEPPPVGQLFATKVWFERTIVACTDYSIIVT